MDTPLGAPPSAVTPSAEPPNRRRHVGLWIGGGAVLVAAVVVVVAATADGGLGASSHGSFCSDLMAAQGTFDHDSFSVFPDPPPAERAHYRTAEATAASLAARAPSDVKVYLIDIAKIYNQALAGKITETDPFNNASSAIDDWVISNCE